MAEALRRSARIRKQSRVIIKVAPSNHTNESITATRPREMVFAKSPIMPSGAAHERWDAQSLSATAPTGRTKLSAVATQIQYFVVALPPRMEVRDHAAIPTIEAYTK